MKRKKIKKRGGKMATLLVFDQALFMRTMIKNLLNKYGYEVFVAGTDEELMDILKNEKVDLVIYDTGHAYSPSVFNRIREVSPKTKITVSTPFNHPMYLFQFQRDGMYPYIQKPYSSWDVLAVVEHYLPGTKKEIPFIINKEKISKMEYRNKSGNTEKLFFKYNGSNFFVDILVEIEEIKEIEIRHNADFMFRCMACGTNEEDYEACPKFLDKHVEMLDILFEDETIQQACPELIKMWNNDKQKN